MLMDENCVIQRANHAASEMFGHNIFEIIGKPCYEIIHGTSEPPEDCPHRRMQLSGQPERGELSLVPIQKTFDLAVAPCVNPSDSFRGCVGIFRDTTSHRSAENELRIANQKLSGWANQLEQRLKEMTLLGEMDDLLQLRVTATQTYGVLAHFGAKLFGEDSGALRLLRKDTKLLGNRGDLGHRSPTGALVSLRTIATRRERHALWILLTAQIRAPTSARLLA